ncbi:MAG: YcxB family protein [Ardenticatenaceae bacterium]|nr:YcxB family protein [Ardenticatenaceae bacterium]
MNGLTTSEEIRITQASLNQTINWKRYVKFKKFSKSLLLYDSPYSFHIFPKHIFEGEEDWKKFVDLVKVQINENKKNNL